MVPYGCGDFRLGQHVQTIDGHAGGVSSVTFSPDGSTLASGSRDGMIRLWNAKSGQHRQTLEGHTAGGLSVAFSPDGGMLASGGGWTAEAIRLWDAQSGLHLRTFDRGFCPSWFLGILARWRYACQRRQPFFSGNEGGVLHSIRLWDVRNGQHRQILDGLTDEVYNVAFSPDGSTLASSGGWSDYTIRLWDVRAGEHLRTLGGHTEPVSSAAFSPDGDTLATTSDDLHDSVVGCPRRIPPTNP